jgi:hypothetical protein
MNYKIILFIFFLCSCASNNINKSKDTSDNINIGKDTSDNINIGKDTSDNINKDNDIIFKHSFSNFSNKGFTLIYDDSLKKKKIISKRIEGRSLIIFQKNLIKDTTVKITNLINNKSLFAKVGPRSDYPSFYNSVISKRIYNILEIDIDEPYVEVLEISENSIFLAKKAKTFDEEKNVADKAPVENISINNLNSDAEKKTISKKNKFNYIIKIADFYYEDTANLMKKRIKSEIKLIIVNVVKLSDTSYRVYLGPFKDLKSLKKAFNDIKIINFENIEIIKT